MPLTVTMYSSTLALVSSALFLTAQAGPALKIALHLPAQERRAAEGRLPIIDASVTNTGDVDLLIRPFNTILQEGVPTHDFEIDGSEADGEAAQPEFTGLIVRTIGYPH